MNIFGVHQECSFIDGSVGKIEFDIYQKSRAHKDGFRLISHSGNFIDIPDDDIIRGLGWGYGRHKGISPLQAMRHDNTSNMDDTDSGIKHYILVNLDIWDIKELVSEYAPREIPSGLGLDPFYFLDSKMKDFMNDIFPQLVSFYRSYQIGKII